MRALVWLPALAMAVLLSFQPGLSVEQEKIERTGALESPVQRDLFAVAWRPVPGDEYALIAGDGGTVLEYTGKFFINLSPNVTAALLGIGWRPDGLRALIVGEQGTVLEFDGNAFRTLSANTTSRLEDAEWRPQGDLAMVVGHDGTLLEFSGGAFTRLNSTVSKPITSVSWRPDGRFAFLCGDFPYVLRFDPESGQVLRLQTGSDQYLRMVAWRPDGGTALVVGTLGSIFLFDGTAFVPLDSPTANQWLAAGWSPDNRTALVAARGGLLFKYEGGIGLWTIDTNTTRSLFSIAYRLNGSYALGVGEGGLVMRYPPAEKPPTPPPADDGAGAGWLLPSALVLLAASVAMIGLAVLLVIRARRHELERRKLEEALERAGELAARKKGT